MANKPSVSEAETSKHFYDLTPDLILDSVERLGVRCTGRMLALNSTENRVFEVEIEVDEEKISSPAERFLIVKFYRPGRWSADQIAEEHRFLLDLQQSEISVIAPLLFADGSTMQVCEGANIFFTIFPKMGGRMLQELSDDDYRRIGRLIARMHQTGESKKAKHRSLLSPQTYGTSNLEFLNTLPREIFPEDIAVAYTNLARSIIDLITPLFDNIKNQRIHGDCHLGNILWNSSGPVLVDFDDMVVGPPVQDLWLLLPGRANDSQRELDCLLAGYEQMRNFDRRTLRLIEPLRALRLIHYASWIARRWDDPAFKKVFSFFGTQTYWKDQIATLHEQREAIQETIYADLF